MYIPHPTAADFEAHGWSPSQAAELEQIEREIVADRRDDERRAERDARENRE